jgi:ABC-type antimicrobial peptide transport system permease subunit
VLHTTGDPMSLGRLVAAEVQTFDRDLPVGSVRTFEMVAAQSVASHRWSALLLSLFAGLGTLLAGAGVYGVMAHLVAMRTGEIGIRLSLGARPGQVLRQIMLEALGTATVGAAIGLAVASAATRSIRSLLFEIEPTDPLALAAAALGILAVTTLAAALPAIRAMRIDPVAALQHQ